MSETRLVELVNGGTTLISAEDWEKVSRHAWRSFRSLATSYVYATVGGKRVYLHRLLTGATGTEEVDHRDGDGLNNTRGNLRKVTHRVNQLNQRNRAVARSGYRGVYPERGVFKASIRVRGRTVNIGRFPTAVRAAEAFDEAAVRFNGDDALTNAKMGLLP